MQTSGQWNEREPLVLGVSFVSRRWNELEKDIDLVRTW